MEVKQLGCRAGLGATPTHPDGSPETGDRDWRLVEALRRREATAAERLVATFGDRAYRLAIGITGNQEDAEEAVQDSFWNVVRRIDTFRGQSSLRSWIYLYLFKLAGVERKVRVALDWTLDLFFPRDIVYLRPLHLAHGSEPVAAAPSTPTAPDPGVPRDHGEAA